MTPQEACYNFVLDKLNKYTAEHPGFYLAVKDGALAGIYHDEVALLANSKKHGKGLMAFHLDPNGCKEFTYPPRFFDD